MSTQDPTPTASPAPGGGLVERVKSILLKPKAEWEVIDDEPATIQGLYLRYAVILAAIPAVAGFLGSILFGSGFMGVTYRPPLMFALSGAVIGYVMSLIGVAVLALVIEFLAPHFGGEKNRIQAFKVAVYSMTAGWVAGVFNLIPALAILAALGGLYGLYLLYLGLPRLMKSPADKALPYTGVVVVVAIIVYLILGAVTGAMAGVSGAARFAERGAASGTVTVPGYGSVDLGKAEAAGSQAERAITAALGDAEGAVQPVAAETLAGLLPATVSGFSRGEISSASGGVGGMNSAEARATYERGDATIRLSITDLGGAAAFAQLGGAFNVNRTEQSGDRYEKVSTVGGRMTTEQYDRSDRSGEYSVLVGQRFMVEAEGRGVEMAQLKSAAQSVGFARLESMAK